MDPTGNSGCQPAPSLCNGSHVSSIVHNYRRLQRYPEDRYRPYVENLVRNIQTHFREKDRKVLIFVHGGLNVYSDAVMRAERLRIKIMAEEEGFYPVFVNWDSGLLSSYGEHLAHIRQGQYDRLGWLTAPVYLGADLLRAVARAPVVWANLLKNDLQTTPLFDEWLREQKDAKLIAADLLQDAELHRADAFPIWTGADKRTVGEKAGYFFKYVLTFPMKPLIAPVLDTAGTSAWNNMLRRTVMLFHTEDEFAGELDSPTSKDVDDARKDPLRGLSHVQPDGALSVFLRELNAAIARDASRADVQPQWKITLVGHSMGAIVVNRLLREFPDFPVDNIVYMAAACSVSDYEGTMFPYLQRNNTRARVYHLTLHELADAREGWNEYTPGIDLPPRGSLLVWIDVFLADPLTPLGRTLGRFTNLVGALHDTPTALRNRISVKKFDVGEDAEDTNPTKHGHFSEPYRFWKPHCWQATHTTDCLSLDSR